MVLRRSKVADRIGDATALILMWICNQVLKPLHAVWLADLYNHLSSPVCVQHIAKGWGKAGISGLLDGQMDLPPEDLFTDIELTLEIDKRSKKFMPVVHKALI